MFYATNKEEAKAMLRQNKIINGDRAIGKTEALIEIIHDDHQGNAIVVSANHGIRDYIKNFYRAKYPGEPLPSFQSPLHAGLGDSRPLYVDVYQLLSEDDRENLGPVLTAAIW